MLDCLSPRGGRVHVDPVVRDCPVVGNGVFGYLHIHQLLARNVAIDYKATITVDSTVYKATARLFVLSGIYVCMMYRAIIVYR